MHKFVRVEVTISICMLERTNLKMVKPEKLLKDFSSYEIFKKRTDEHYSFDNVCVFCPLKFQQM